MGRIAQKAMALEADRVLKYAINEMSQKIPGSAGDDWSRRCPNSALRLSHLAAQCLTGLSQCFAILRETRYPREFSYRSIFSA
jgi:hypothetical protein